MKSAIRVPIFGLALALGLSACGASTPEAQPESATPIEVKIPPVWPLTGLPGPEDAQDRPLVVVKIENDPVVRPQTGLDRADLIFEELVEGGMTRFAVAFHSDLPDEVGPVRSVRHVDVAIAEPMADAFVFSGGAKRTMRFVKRKLPTTVSVVNEGAPGMFRKKGLYAPHNLFLNMNEMLEATAEHNTPTSGFFVRPEPQPEPSQTPEASASPGASSTAVEYGKSVTDVSVNFSKFAGPNWAWDSTKQLWMRSEGVKPFMNKDGSQFGTNNLVIIEVREINAGYKGQTGGYVPRTVLTGSGRGWVLSEGKAYEVFWNKPTLKAQMELKDPTGKPFAMPIGRSWVELLPVSVEGASVFTGKYSFDGVEVPVINLPIPAKVPEPTDLP
jgi:hypothetical protein